MTRIDSDQSCQGPSPLALCLARNGEVVVPHLNIACTFFARFAGLQFRRSLPAGHGLLLVPCSSIHTACMRFAINAFMLDGAGIVRRVVENLRPWSAAFAPRGTRAVLELSTTAPTIATGEQLRLVVRGQLSRRLMHRVGFLSVDPRGDHVASKGEL